MRRFEARLPLAFGTLVALVATAGSLYFSLGLGLVPCELCWYQRILMYPLVLVLGVAALENRRRVFLTAFPLSILGTIVAAYHSWLQVSDTTGTCSVGGGCSAVQYQIAGLSIPNLSLVAFVLITLALFVTIRSR
ncbi:disulfide bond formation protein B [Halococcus sp. IIIV-5B]|uniref:disulfide bond formation protein B n=1 Tax=Halococcus sp. IIIV-5B TaxID=2321230 RepID=UPI000E75F9F1|nr:disulfide bond formation protein B [Halococcus sp. IIIV-5B]RJT00773.1 disulfide bond formation protein B [Halococcus sp. IIIV-5B]